jgi:hypothetical protein
MQKDVGWSVQCRPSWSLELLEILKSALEVLESVPEMLDVLEVSESVRLERITDLVCTHTHTHTHTHKHMHRPCPRHRSSASWRYIPFRAQRRAAELISAHLPKRSNCMSINGVDRSVDDNPRFTKYITSNRQLGFCVEIPGDIRKVPINES